MPKIIRVDGIDNTEDENNIFWTWANKNGDDESVYLGSGGIALIQNSDSQVTEIYSQDIPHLVKALTLAYKHIEGKDIVL